MKAVLDTNIIISTLNFPGNERLVLDLARRGFTSYIFPLSFWQKRPACSGVNSDGRKHRRNGRLRCWS